MDLKCEIVRSRRVLCADLACISLVLSWLVIEAACAHPPSTAMARAALTASCTPAADLGILPGRDNRAAFAAIPTDSCVQLAAGTYELATIAPTRATTVWTMPPNVQLVGTGPGQTVLSFTGETGIYDWRGIQLAPGAWIHELSLDSTALVAAPGNDQRHMVRMDGNGSTAPVTLDHLTCMHFAGGDCFQFVGYSPAPPTNVDRRIWNVRIHDIEATSHRSVIAVHSGLNNYEFYNIIGRATDQVFDFEGSGDTFDGNIHDNVILLADGQQSSIGADINSLTRLHYHHNTSPQLGMQIYYCWNCEFDHNVIVQAVPNNAATVAVIAADGIWFHDETYVRNAGMINGPVFSATTHGSVPTHNIRITDSELTQHMSWTGVNLVGVQGFTAEHLTYTTDGTGPARIAINAESIISGGVVRVQTSDITVRYSKLTSAAQPFYAAITIGAGVGAVSVLDNTVVNATRGMTCGNGAGPMTYANNVMPAPTCAPGAP